MRVCFILLAAAAAFFIGSSATEVSNEAELARMVSSEIVVASRFLRRHRTAAAAVADDDDEEEEEDSEERVLDVTAVTKIDDLLNIQKLDDALSGDLVKQQGLFRTLLEAPKDILITALNKIALGEDGLKKYQALFNKWNEYKRWFKPRKGIMRKGYGFPVSYKGP
uniref:RxLR effector protein n=1 Tax=Phytophthora agathidicida TaxID=1642459 RepID=A0A7G4WI22_9STRA|nr:PaRXLR33 [Phytophthora agathidicida]